MPTRVLRTLISIVSTAAVVVGCAATSGGLRSIPEPEDQKSLVVGCILVENINQGFPWRNWDYGFQVVILGQTSRGEIQHYRVTADSKGYFCLPNVPPGQYAVKAVILPMFGSLPVKIVNDLVSENSEFYRMRHPEEPIEYTARWFPPMKVRGRIGNLDILWLGLRRADVEDIVAKSVGKVIAIRVEGELRNRRFYEQGFVYTRKDPLEYFKSKFPNSGWWKEL